MGRSQVCFILAALIGMPAWIVDVNALPQTGQVAWFAAMLIAGLLGCMFWAIDRK